jgi:uncharacterized protein YfbU (UPF0304 family)
MKLSDGEKIIILMLTELFEKLQVDGEMEPDFLRSAIFNDMLWGIRWKYSGIPFSEAEDPEVVKEVLDILDMWSSIERSYAGLDSAGKESIKHSLGALGDSPRFQGFDGNNESEYVGTALFLVNQLDRFVEFKGRGFNCHHPSIEMHRRMLSAFEPMRRRHMSPDLSAGQILQVLQEQVHPSNRETPSSN